MQQELSDAGAPSAVQDWITNPPIWLEIRETSSCRLDPGIVEGLDEGEVAAIALAASLVADLLLMDDRKGVIAARSLGLLVTGTLGVLDLAAHRGLIGFAQAIASLRRTSFRMPEDLLNLLLKKHASGL